MTRKPEPFSLAIGHMTVVVAPMTDAQARKLEAEGVYIETKFLIMVRSRTSPAEQARVLIHELLHACYDAGGWGDEARDQEAVCGFLDRGLALVFQQNPSLLARLALALNHNIGIFESAPEPASSISAAP